MSHNFYLVLLALVPALLNAGILVYIFTYLPKSRITNIFGCFVFALLLWQLEDSLVRMSETAENAKFWDKLFCIGWLGMAPLALHFACKMADLKKLTSRRGLFLNYFPFILFYLLYSANSSENDFIFDETWGWINTPKPGSIDEYQRYYIALVIMTTVFILLKNAWNPKNNSDKKIQARILAIGILVPAIQGIVTQVVLPLVAKQKEIPLTSTFMSFFSCATIIAISKYKLFHVSDSINTDIFLNNLKKLVFIVSPERKIIYANIQAATELGIKAEDPQSYPLRSIFKTSDQFDNYINSVFNKSLSGETIHNYSSEMVNKNQEKIDVLITTSPVINNNILQGVLILANDITAMVSALTELDNERKMKEKAITNAVILAQEKERKTLGSELHDNINQILASSLLYLNMVKNDKAGNSEYLEEMGGLIHHAIDEIRKLSHTLIAPSLNDTELTEAIEKIISLAGKTGLLHVQKDIKGLDEKGLPEKLKLNIYRIVQEQFNNIIKYARAKNIYIQLIQEQEQLLLRIKDDGVGFDPAIKMGGVGLTNMKTRASLHNGELTIISSPGMGCEINVLFENIHSQS